MEIDGIGMVSLPLYPLSTTVGFKKFLAGNDRDQPTTGGYGSNLRPVQVALVPWQLRWKVAILSHKFVCTFSTTTTHSKHLGLGLEEQVFEENSGWFSST